MDADGSAVSLFPFIPRTPSLLALETWGQPLITGDDRYLLVMNGGYPIGIGTPFVTAAGQQAVYCAGWGTDIIRLAPDQIHVMVQTESGLAMYSPADCGTGNPPIMTFEGVTGVMSPNGEYAARVTPVVLSSDEPTIIIRQPVTGLEWTVGPGDSPAWSSDSQWLAYTGPDGIYVVSVSNGAKPRRLVFHENPDPSGSVPLYRMNPRPSLFFPPAVSWSPDGKWLIYHLYLQNLGEDAEGSAQHYSIVKASVPTGEEIKLYDGGWTPHWRWPASP